MCGWIRHGTLVNEGVRRTMSTTDTQKIYIIIIKHFRSNAHNFLIQNVMHKIRWWRNIISLYIWFFKILFMHKDAIILCGWSFELPVALTLSIEYSD